MDLRSQRVPAWSKKLLKGRQREHKRHQSVSKGRRRVPKWPQSGPKSDKKGSPNAPERSQMLPMAPNGPQQGPGGSDIVKMSINTMVFHRFRGSTVPLLPVNLIKRWTGKHLSFGMVSWSLTFTKKTETPMSNIFSKRFHRQAGKQAKN